MGPRTSTPTVASAWRHLLLVTNAPLVPMWCLTTTKIWIWLTWWCSPAQISHGATPYYSSASWRPKKSVAPKSLSLIPAKLPLLNVPIYIWRSIRAATWPYTTVCCTISTFTANQTRFIFVVAALSAANDTNIPETTDIAQSQLDAFYALFSNTERTVSVWSQGVNQSSAGTDKVNAIINCHLLTGRIGKPAMGPFSITGQPHAMGGREVGGLANMLAAHTATENPQHRDIVQRFGASPTIAMSAGLKAVDMFDAVADGRIKAIWIMATNPIVSMPNADAIRDALKACPFFVVSEAVNNSDTAKLAHVLLPAAAWGKRMEPLLIQSAVFPGSVPFCLHQNRPNKIEKSSAM